MKGWVFMFGYPHFMLMCAKTKTLQKQTPIASKGDKTAALRQSNDVLVRSKRSSFIPQTIEEFNARLTAIERAREVPMITFLTCKAIHQLEDFLGVQISSINFKDKTERGIPVFGGTYYASFSTLAMQVRYYARKNLNIELAGHGPKPLVRFLELIRDGASRKEAADQMFRNREASRPSNNSPD